MPQIGTKGANLDLLIRQGATFGPNFCELKTANGEAINITGAIIRGQVRKTATAGVSATVTSTLIDPALGTFSWEITDEQTTLLVADANSETAAASIYVWDLEIEYPNGKVYPLLYGAVNVFREVTKVDP